MIATPKNKLLLIIIGILLLANLVLISFFVANKVGSKKSMRGDKKAITGNFLKNEIGFSSQQLQLFDSVSNQQQAVLKPLYTKIKEDKAQQFKKLTTANFTETLIIAAADTIAATHRNIEIEMANYQKKIRNICTPQQQPKFDSLFYLLLHKRNEGYKK